MGKRNYSIFSVLFFAMVILATLIYLINQLIDFTQNPSSAVHVTGNLSLSDRLWEYRFALIMISSTTAAIWLTLHFTLRPMRRLSEKAGAIEPSNLHERLPIENAPKEIAPLVTAFNDSLERLETAWNVQRSFSANAAHELRTPIAVLRAHVESMFPAEERGIVTAEFERLARLIDQLLNLAEADQDHLKNNEKFDLVTLAEETAKEMAPKIIVKGWEISFETEITQLYVDGDIILIGIALRNLIENAIKHTPKGTQIIVKLSPDYRITIMDNGPGIPKDFQNELFKRFSKYNKNGNGAGLGLSIVARIMGLHGGKAYYESRPNGSAFHLLFPNPLFGA